MGWVLHGARYTCHNLATMTQNERNIASLFMIRADAEFWDDQVYKDGILRLIDQGIGGIGVFKGGLEKTAEMIDEIQRRGGHNVLIAADFEHGLPMRLEGGIAYPRAMALGKSLPGVTYHVAECIAKEAKAIGVHWNWAPVADVNSNSDNPIINTRSFGEDASKVAEHVVAYIDGTQKMGVLACAKHFPGHGDTATDSHLSLPVLSVDQSTAAKREFVPFQAAVSQGVRSVMVGHIVVPFLGHQLPASLNPSVVAGLLKGTWGYNGLVCTDAMDMGAITNNYSSGVAAALALNAGVDVVLMPADIQEAFNHVVADVEKGAIPDTRIQDALGRWKAAKDFVMPKPRRRKEPIVIDQTAHAQIALKSADVAIHIRGNSTLIPLTQHKHVAVFGVVGEAEADSATTFFNYLAQGTENNIDFGFIDGSIAGADLHELCVGTADADVFVFAFFGKAVAFQGSIQGQENVPGIMTTLARGKPCIVVACGSPYNIDLLNAECYVYSYSDTTPSIAASVLRLIGRSPE